MSKQDILIDATTMDLTFLNGSFHIGKSDLQQANLIILAHKGEYRQHPELGVGITDFIGTQSSQQLSIRNIISDQLEKDNISLIDIIVDLTSYEDFTFDIQINETI